MTASPSKTRSTRVISAAVLAMAIACGLVLSRVMPPTETAPALEWLTHPRPVAAFTLASAEGEMTANALRGHWHLLILGFTQCADVCPTTLEQLAQLRAQIADDRVRVIFVSIDPARDTPTRLAAYVQYFGKGFIGITGARDQLRALAMSLGMNFRSTGALDEPRISHSPTIAVIDPGGFLRGRLRPGLDIPRVAREFRVRIGTDS